ncbi:hypothetical protein ACFQ4Z_09515 [Oceanobacillus oncorhynchi subsp. oncorhynchi]|uniref:hypothetical protein n=1 Tax=Oceanobacillus oncorhynchi TaxID=545501 RepID=UPI0036409D80
MCFKRKLGLLFVVGSLLLLSPIGAIKVMAIADYDGSVDSEEVEENLELPDMHENTIIYNGTINPELALRIHLPGSDNVVSPYVNEDGQFSTELLMREFEAGDEITFLFGEDGKEPQERTIEVQPEEEGKVVVESSADTSAVEEVIEEGTSIDWPENNDSIRFNLSTIGDVDGQIYYAREGKTINEHTQLEDMGPTSFTAFLAPSEEDYEEQTDSDDYPQPGEKVNIYIPALGVTAVIETEIPDNLDVWKEEDNQENGMESNDDKNETGASASSNEGASDNTSAEDSNNNEGTENNSNDNETDGTAENTDNNHTADDTANAEDTESAVSDANESSGGMSALGWSLIGIGLLAIIISGIIWGKRRRST